MNTSILLLIIIIISFSIHLIRNGKIEAAKKFIMLAWGGMVLILSYQLYCDIITCKKPQLVTEVPKEKIVEKALSEENQISNKIRENLSCDKVFRAFVRPVDKNYFAKDINTFYSLQRYSFASLGMTIKTAVVKTMIEEGYSLIYPKNDLPLITALATEQREFISLLSQYELCLNTADDNGVSPLHYAAVTGNIFAVKEFLKTNKLSADDEQDALCGAILHFNFNIAGLLLLDQASMSIKSKYYEKSGNEILEYLKSCMSADYIVVLGHLARSQ